MADPTLAFTHYWPWDGDEQQAVCGAFMRGDASRHSLTPSCPACATHLQAEDDRVDALVAPLVLSLDADEAAALRVVPPAPAPYQRLAAELLDAMRFWTVAGADEQHLQACIADLLEQEVPTILDGGAR